MSVMPEADIIQRIQSQRALKESMNAENETHKIVFLQKIYVQQHKKIHAH